MAQAHARLHRSKTGEAPKQAMAAGNGSFAYSHRGPFVHTSVGAGLRAACSVFAADVRRRHMPACTGAKREKRRNGAMAAGEVYIRVGGIYP